MSMQQSMHPSYFEFSYHVENLLFKGLTVSSVGGLIGLCLGVAAFSVLYESITASRHYLVEVQKRTEESISVRSVRSRLEHQLADSQCDLLYGKIDSEKWSRMKFHMLQTLLHVLQVSMGFFVMLIIMRYNGWIAITILLASGVAHYFLGVLLFRRPVVVPVETPTLH